MLLIIILHEFHRVLNVGVCELNYIFVYFKLHFTIHMEIDMKIHVWCEKSGQMGGCVFTHVYSTVQ